MKYKPTKTELERSHSYLSSQPSNLRDTSLYVSGSEWSKKHLQALRVVVMDDIGINKLISSRSIPHPNKKIFKDLQADSKVVDKQTLKNWDTATNQLQNNKLSSFFGWLHLAMENDETSDLPQSGHDSPSLRSCGSSEHISKPSHSSEEPVGSSHSSEENPPEAPSRQALQQLLEIITKELSNKHDTKWRLMMVPYDISREIDLGPAQGRTKIRHANNDGGLVLYRTRTRGKKKRRRVGDPLVGFEVSAKRHHLVANIVNERRRPRDAISLKRYGTQASPRNTTPRAPPSKAEHGSAGDQENFVITIHGTQVRLVTAYFTAEYLGYLESAEMPVNQHLYVRRSRFFEMKDPADRKEALKMCIGLVEYLLSGYAAIEQVRDVAKKLKRGHLGKSRRGRK